MVSVEVSLLQQTRLNVLMTGYYITTLLKEQQVIVYLDFSKAFDVVSHPKLRARLHS